MKRKYILLAISCLILFIGSACKKFLDVTPIDRLSGNMFWNSSKDVESFLADTYGLLFDKFNASSLLAATGELRLGEITPNIYGTTYKSSQTDRRISYNSLTKNDLLVAVDTTQSWTRSSASFVKLNYNDITKWVEFYSVVQSANTLVAKMDGDINTISAEEKRQYKAEGIYIRCLTYFLMVRIYGDVVYYTDPNHASPMRRENFVSVLNKCIEDLAAVKNDFPRQYADPALTGVRPSRSSALSLLMNMNMWNAGFDVANKATYYQKTKELGQELMATHLFPLVNPTNLSSVMAGNSGEGLFELKNNYANISSFNNAAFPGEAFISSPYKKDINGNGLYNHAFFNAAYLKQIYNITGSGSVDPRFQLWFGGELPAPRTGSTTGLPEGAGIITLQKFTGNTGIYGYPEWSIVLFRYADAVLLRAEALAELGADGEALDVLNLIRKNAGAPQFPSTLMGQALKDEIFLERERELIGEGYRFFDLVRTGRIMNPSFCTNYLTKPQFDSGAWTWPIHSSAKNRNPFINLNAYWQ